MTDEQIQKICDAIRAASPQTVFDAQTGGPDTEENFVRALDRIATMIDRSEVVECVARSIAERQDGSLAAAIQTLASAVYDGAHEIAMAINEREGTETPPRPRVVRRSLLTKPRQEVK